MSMMQLVALSVTPAFERPCMALPVLTVLIVFEQAPNIKPMAMIAISFIILPCWLGCRFAYPVR